MILPKRFYTTKTQSRSRVQLMDTWPICQNLADQRSCSEDSTTASRLQAVDVRACGYRTPNAVVLAVDVFDTGYLLARNLSEADARACV